MHFSSVFLSGDARADRARDVNHLQKQLDDRHKDGVWQGLAVAGSAKTRGKRLDPMGYPTWIGGFRGFGEVGRLGKVGDVVVATVF